MTANDIIIAARMIRGDTEPYNPSDPNMILFLNAGQRLIVSMRPDALCQTDGSYATLAKVNAIDDVLTIPDRFFDPLMDYVIARSFQLNGEDSKSLARAQHHFDLFTKLTATV